MQLCTKIEKQNELNILPHDSFNDRGRGDLDVDVIFGLTPMHKFHISSTFRLTLEGPLNRIEKSSSFTPRLT